MDIRARLVTPQSGAAALALGVLLLVGTCVTGVCQMQDGLAYALIAALSACAVGTLVGWKWARMAGRIVSWVGVALFAMMIVPDWDDAVLHDAYGLHRICGGLAIYFVLCAIVLGFRRQPQPNRS